MMDPRFIFSTTYSVWNKLCAQYQQPAIEVKTTSSKPFRAVAKIVNVAKKSTICLAFVVSTIATGIFCILALPYKTYKKNSVFAKACKEDIARLTKEERNAIRNEISTYIVKNKCRILPQDKKRCLDQLLASYARSNKIYGPIARAWVEHLLDKANREEKKLVFLARDGTAPYKIAKKLMDDPEYQKKYPNLCGDKKLVLAYFSRKLVSNSAETENGRQLFKEYAQNQLGITPSSQSLFVDVGFTGSMIDAIKEMLSPAHIEYEYLISMTHKANGFIATKDKQLASVPSAGKNLGVHWLEDMHQGNIKSPSALVKVDDQIYPNSLEPSKKKLCTEKNSFDYLLRKFSLKGVVDAYKQILLNPEQLSLQREKFNETLERIKNTSMPLFGKHI